MPADVYPVAEHAARHAKADHLLDVIGRLNARLAGHYTAPQSADDVAGWSDLSWALATEIANRDFRSRHGLPSQRTRALVVFRLRERERLAAMTDDDVFGGLGG